MPDASASTIAGCFVPFEVTTRPAVYEEQERFNERTGKSLGMVRVCVRDEEKGVEAFGHFFVKMESYCNEDGDDLETVILRKLRVKTGVSRIVDDEADFYGLVVGDELCGVAGDCSGWWSCVSSPWNDNYSKAMAKVAKLKLKLEALGLKVDGYGLMTHLSVAD